MEELTSRKRIYLRRALLAATILVCSVLQNTDGWFPRIAGAGALLLIPLTAAIAMFERDISGMLFGLFAGALWDIFASGNNFNAMFFVIMGFTCGTLINLVMRNNFVTHLILTAAFTFIYCTGYWLWHFVFAGTGGSFYAYMVYYLPSIIYTAVLSPAFFFLVRAIELLFRNK